MDWAPLSSRPAKARLKGEIANVAILAEYAPTLDADDGVKDASCAELQAAVENVPTGDILVVAGDWNARTGPADEISRQVLGNFGLVTPCANGGHLVNFATANRLVVTNTRFQHPRRHLVTLYSNSQRT